MCLPALALAGLAVMAGGAGLNYFGEKKADKALTRTFNREHDRQQAFQAEQNAKFQDSLNSVGNMADPTAQASAAANREAVLDAAIKNADPVASGYLPGSSSAPKIVATAGAQAGAKANAASGALARAIAAMSGFGDLQQQTNIGIGRDAQAIGQIGGFARGSMDALQPELDAAKRKGSTLRALGGLAQSIGSAMLSGGGGGGAGAIGPAIRAANASPSGFSYGLSGFAPGVI